MFRLFSLVFLLVITGICSQEWGVQYPNPVKCALNGSSILLSGTYKHPAHLTVKEIFWTVNPVRGEENINLSDHPDYKGRVQYLSKKSLTSDLQLHNVTHKDERMYCIRIMSNVNNQSYLGIPGIRIKITVLRVEVPAEVVEKHSAVLYCKTTCVLGGKTVIWYKNGKLLPESVGMYKLSLPWVSREDAGNYSCALRNQNHLSSPAVNLDVRYPPRNVLASEVLEGDSVRLMCSSDSNPPALNFSWFQENHTSAVGSGQSFSISSFTSSLSGRFYCMAYNKYGSQRSHAVSLSLKESSSSWIRRRVAVSLSAVGTSMIMAAFIYQYRQLQHSKKVKSENTYMNIELSSRRSEYDTLDNMERNADDPEDQDPVYNNIDI